MINKIKSERGITLSALMLYIVVFMIIISTMTIISTSFFNGLDKVMDTPKYVSEFNKFVMFFVTDVKNYNEADVTSDTIIFKNGPIYEYKNNTIYRNDVEIANSIINCTFTPKQYNVNTVIKNLINVNMLIGQNGESIIGRNIDFTLRYW